MAARALLPVGLKPPMLEMACGVSPTWPMTATPASEMARAASTRRAPPPSILTASMPPSLSSRTAAPTACSALASYEPKGRSPMSSGRRAPRATARQCDTISSSVTGSVVSWPSTTMPTLSPTSSMSMPAASTCAAEG